MPRHRSTARKGGKFLRKGGGATVGLGDGGPCRTRHLPSNPRNRHMREGEHVLRSTSSAMGTERTRHERGPTLSRGSPSESASLPEVTRGPSKSSPRKCIGKPPPRMSGHPDRAAAGMPDRPELGQPAARPSPRRGNLLLSATPCRFQTNFLDNSGQTSANSRRTRPNPTRLRLKSARIRTNARDVGHVAKLGRA